MRTVGFIQARLYSSRFPRKVIQPLCDTTVIGYMIRRLRRAIRLDRLVVALPRGESELIREVARHGAETFEGDASDVLDRIYRGAVQYEADVVVRFTADCPLVDPVLVDRMIERHAQDALDYLGFGLRSTFPDGLGTEVVSTEALAKAHSAATASEEREHVTWHIRVRPNQFRVGVFALEANHGHIRCTLDYPEDLRVIREIVSALDPNGDRIFGYEQIIDLHRRRPDLFLANRAIPLRDPNSPQPDPDSVSP